MHLWVHIYSPAARREFDQNAANRAGKRYPRPFRAVMVSHGKAIRADPTLPCEAFDQRILRHQERKLSRHGGSISKGTGGGKESSIELFMPCHPPQSGKTAVAALPCNTVAALRLHSPYTDSVEAVISSCRMKRRRRCRVSCRIIFR